jgi:hypothetical protein
VSTPLRRAPVYWLGLMAAGGFVFGLFGDRRPFGPDVLGHPLVIFFCVVGIGLLILRVALARPVPAVIPERLLLIGCLIGLAMFLAGNFVSIYVMSACADARSSTRSLFC